MDSDRLAETIIKYLTKNPGSTSKEIAKSLGITSKDINRSNGDYPGIYKLHGLKHEKHRHYIDETKIVNEDYEDLGVGAGAGAAAGVGTGKGSSARYSNGIESELIIAELKKDLRQATDTNRELKSKIVSLEKVLKQYEDLFRRGLAISVS